MPAIVDDAADLAAIASGDLGPLVPPGASYENRSTIEDPFEQIALTWSDGVPPEGRNGLIVWQRSEDGTWRAVYAFTDPARRGVFGIRVDTGDLTGDAIPDILSFEDVGGSGACGTYRVIATTVGDASEIFRREACDTQIAISSAISGSARRSSAPTTRTAARARSASPPAVERRLLGRDLVGGRARTTPPDGVPLPRRPVARPPSVARRRTRAAKGLRRPSERPIQGAIPAIDVGKAGSERERSRWGAESCVRGARTCAGRCGRFRVPPGGQGGRPALARDAAVGRARRRGRRLPAHHRGRRRPDRRRPAPRRSPRSSNAGCSTPASRSRSGTPTGSSSSRPTPP